VDMAKVLLLSQLLSHNYLPQNKSTMTHQVMTDHSIFGFARQKQ